MLCFRDNGTWFFGGVLEVLHQFHRKNTTGVPSVSTGYRYNRKTPADPFRKRILRIPSYSMKRGTAWLRQLMLHVWFKQCDVWPQPRTNSSVELPTSSFTLQKNKKWKSLRKANKECSPFQWYWNQPLKKNVFFAFQTFSQKKNDQLSRQLRRAPPTAGRPSTPTRWPRRARLPRLLPVKGWRMWRQCGAVPLLFRRPFRAGFDVFFLVGEGVVLRCEHEKVRV